VLPGPQDQIIAIETGNVNFIDFRPALEGTPHSTPHVMVSGSQQQKYEEHFITAKLFFF
jgi:hypothetical protein